MEKRKWLLIFLIAALLFQSGHLVIVSAASDSDQWTMYGKDLSHSRYAGDDYSENSAALLWNYTMGRNVQSSPAVADGFIFVSNRDSRVYCLNSTTGEFVWKNNVYNTELWSSPFLYNGFLYVAADNGYLYCINMTTGNTLWVSQINGTTRSSPAISDNRLYIGSGDHDLVCINASNGDSIWRFPTSLRIQTSPSVVDGVVYFGADDYFVYAVNASSGKEIWKEHTASTVSSPTISNGRVYIGSDDGFFTCLNASSGKQIWKYTTEASIYSSPAIAYGCVYFGSLNNYVYCLNATDGSKIWQSPTGYWVTSSPTVSGAKVYVGSQDWGIYCFDAYTGSKLWSFQTKNIIESSPVVAGDMLYVGSDDSTLYAFKLYNATTPIFPKQDAINVPWTTVAFDAIACSIGVLAMYEVFLFAKGKMANKTATNTAPKKLWVSRHIELLSILAILAFSSIFLIYLGKGPLWVSDEQTYSQWAFHMVKTGDYLTPWAYSSMTFWIAKPPLAIWLMSLSGQVLGLTNIAIRLWGVLFGALTLVTVFYLGKKLFNEIVGFVSAIILGTFVTFYSFASHAMTDVPFVFFAVASIYFIIFSSSNEKPNRYAALSGMFFGLAFLTKQVEALIIPLIIFLYLLVTKRSLRFVFTKWFTLFWSVGLLVFVPWLIYMVGSFGQDFWQTFFVYAGLTRTLSPIEGHDGGLLFYFTYLYRYENPFWVALLPFSIGLCVFYTIKKRSKADMLILVWVLIVLGLFTFAQTKLFWYILPAFPAFALAIGNLVYTVALFVKSRQKLLFRK